jgi:hypothetical protein
VFHSAISYVVCDSSAVLARNLDARRLALLPFFAQKSPGSDIHVFILFLPFVICLSFGLAHISRFRRSTVLAWWNQSILGFLLLLDRRDSGV